MSKHDGHLHYYQVRATGVEAPPADTPSGVKHDQQKLRMDLLDPVWTEGVAKVLTFGAEKYAAHNWRGGIVYSRLIAAMKRHLLEIEKGIDIDPETGLLHAYHISCCVMFLARFQADGREELDDRVGTVQTTHAEI